ncbi:GAF domain-containing protein [Streptomyces sp. A7024]|uniref:GAF domain-containing protein n=1 Tax=Streptomyces coryli TaxID=1128680 RepID=A0A6G4TRR5_9ACTN|nr:GAF domain-containing protein [Streptomyces coryli]NGN62482.1 GAF domain-containing protein [Streptomyces coryli]
MPPDSARGARREPRLPLDELVDELQVRLDEVRGAHGRLHHLLEAVMSVGRDLELPQVLRRIVEAAVELVDAEYGALGVIGESHEEKQLLSHFLPVGIGREQIAAIGDHPCGRGILGVLIRHPEPLRLRELSEHPGSYGFPPHHPPMRSFLGAPIRVRDEVFGNLYLTEKRGAKEFDREDESVLSTLATAAGVAIENARLYEESRWRQRWMAASAEVTSMLLSGAEQQEVLALIVDRAKGQLGADLGAISVPENDRQLRVALAAGAGAEVYQSHAIPLTGTLTGLAFTRGELERSDDVQSDARTLGSVLREVGMGAMVAVPIGTEAGRRGVLMLARLPDKPAFTHEETAPLQGFAAQAGLALELADRRRDAEQIAVYEDRDRIARDLHDLAIQRLFATGMTLQSALRLQSSAAGEEKLLRAVRDLDDTIKIVRTTIFGLRAHDAGTASDGLRVRVMRQIEGATESLGFSPALRTEGLLDVNVPRHVADHAVAVLGEALTNAARHAQADAVDVHVVCGAEDLSLTVSDNGVGMPADGRRSGLANLEHRARELGGALDVDAPPGGGTRLTWRVPLRPDSAGPNGPG